MSSDAELQLGRIGLGCWPMAGVSTLGVTDEESLATIHEAIDRQVVHLDTAYSYGFAGESDHLLSQVLKTRRHEVTIASKVGQFFDREKKRQIDGRPETLIRHAKEALERLQVDYVDVMYLHVPDPKVPLTESAGAIKRILDLGLARWAGVSNVDADQLRAFHAECAVSVVQPPFNMLQQETLHALRSSCQELGIRSVCYWILMKGLLAGHFQRDHSFDPADKRLTYPVYQGKAWQRAQDLLDHLRSFSADRECTVGQLVVAWSLHQPGVDMALCGARRPAQIAEMADAGKIVLSKSDLEQIDGWIQQASGA